MLWSERVRRHRDTKNDCTSVDVELVLHLSGDFLLVVAGTI